MTKKLDQIEKILLNSIENSQTNQGKMETQIISLNEVVNNVNNNFNTFVQNSKDLKLDSETDSDNDLQEGIDVLTNQIEIMSKDIKTELNEIEILQTKNFQKLDQQLDANLIQIQEDLASVNETLKLGSEYNRYCGSSLIKREPYKPARGLNLGQMVLYDSWRLSFSITQHSLWCRVSYCFI